MTDNSKTKPKKKRYRSINGKMYAVIVLLVFLAAVICIVYTAQFYIVQELTTFASRITQISDSYAEFFNDPQLNDLSDLVLSEAFGKVRKQAEAEGDPEKIDQLISDAGLKDFMAQSEYRLYRIQEANQVTELYLASCNDSGCYYILHMDDDFAQEGDALPFTPNPEDLEQRNTTASGYNMDMDGTRENYRVRIAAMTPIGVSADNSRSTWLVSETDIKPVILEFGQFLARLFVFLIIVSAVFAIIGVLVLRHLLTNPIIRLKRSVVDFETRNTAENAALPIDPGISRRDELGDLSSSLYSLEQNVYDTQKELSRLSEEKGRMSAQLSIASSIQQGVLPSEFPVNESFDLYGLMQPAKQVGGDFFDYFMIDDSHLALVIADVSDKGIPASLFMMTSKTLLISHARMGKSPAEVLAAVNDQLSGKNPANFFVTVWFGILDLCTGHMIAANGGHEFPLLSLRGEPFRIYKDEHGLALGSIAGAKYHEYELQFDPGDRMLVYSDGATDAINSEEKAFGIEQLEKTVQTLGNHHNAEQLVHGVLAALMDYSKDTYQFDDITLLSLTFLKRKECPDQQPSDLQNTEEQSCTTEE